MCRRTDKQPADLPNQEGEDEDVQELAMDDVLMMDQEPEPGFDLDDAQRPRLSRVRIKYVAHVTVCSYMSHVHVQSASTQAHKPKMGMCTPSLEKEPLCTETHSSYCILDTCRVLVMTHDHHIHDRGSRV